MIWRRVVVIGAILCLMVVLLVPTGGFNTTSADRTVAISVVSDETAYLSVERQCNNETMAVRITNRFPASTVVDIYITANETTKTIDNLSPQMSQTKTFETVDTVTITASSSEASVHLTRPATAC